MWHKVPTRSDILQSRDCIFFILVSLHPGILADGGVQEKVEEWMNIYWRCSAQTCIAGVLQNQTLKIPGFIGTDHVKPVWHCSQRTWASMQRGWREDTRPAEMLQRFICAHLLVLRQSRCKLAVYQWAAVWVGTVALQPTNSLQATHGSQHTPWAESSAAGHSL